MSGNPRVSILIPSRSQDALLANCLNSLRLHIGGDIAYEVVIVMNSATDALKSFVRERTRGLVVRESDANLGVAGGYNRARASARGEFLMLLHDDTEIQPGWIESLLETMATHPAAGAVGSFQFFPDGRPQRAGSILWRNALTTTTWANVAPDPGTFTDVRPVDYSGTCSTLVRASTWDAIGGMDEEIFPAYYVDVDLCMKIRRHGQTVLCDPRSRILHHAGASTNRSFQQFISRCNQLYIITKWSAELDQQEPYVPEDPASLERAKQITASTAATLTDHWKEPGHASPAPPVPAPECQEREHEKREKALLANYLKHLETCDTLLNERLATMSTDLASTHDQLAGVQAGLTASQGEIAELQARIRKLRKRNNALQSELAESRKSLFSRLIRKWKSSAG
ncbi:MAG: glycosyltransferase [Verrucomicrobiota bacterium]